MSTTTNKKIKQVKEFEDIMTCIFEHEVSKSAILYEWKGPKLDREMWNQVLAFFRWTQVTSRSESQVRLYVNYKTKVWKAWAFPQTEGTGMTTREIDNEAYKEQRAQFSDAEGWLYYGTVHHHCSASAFQSSTDEANERGQDGLHITVGKMDSPQYDIDARLYQSGYKVPEWKIEEFWDPGDVYAGLSQPVKDLLPKDFPQRMVLLQMCTPPPNDQVFPDIWKANVIREVRVVPKMTQNYGNNQQYFGSHYNRKPFTERSHIEGDFDRKRFVQDVLLHISLPRTASNEVTLDDIRSTIKNCQTIMMLQDCDILDIMLRNDIRFTTALGLLDAVEKLMREEALEKELEAKLEARVGKAKGKPAPARLGLPSVGSGQTTTKSNGHMGAIEHMESEGGGHYSGYGSGYGIGG